jgi:hypothetical protein
MMCFRPLLSFAIWFSPFLLWGKANQKEPLFQPHDLWYEVYLGDMKAGYAQDKIYRDGDVVKSRNEMVMQIKRVGQVVEIKAVQTVVEKLSGELVSFSTETKMAGIPMIKKGKVEGNELVVYERQFVKGKESRYPFDPEGRMSWGLQKEVLGRGFKQAGAHFETMVYSPDLSMRSPVPARFEMYGEKSLLHGGVRVDAYEVVMTIKSGLAEVRTKSWLDKEGKALRTEMNMGGIQLRLVQVPEKKAKKMEADVEEFLLETMISLGEAIPRGARATTFHMQSIQGPWDGELHQGPLQQVKKINEKVVEVLVQSEELVKGEVLPREKRREYLAPNLYLDSDDLLIQNLAKEAIGQENEPIKIAGLLSSFVHRYINSKNFAVGFASASEVARKRAGDCTEHSVLLAALGRACQIPSRVVTGLVYAPRFEGKRHVLVYHMWTQFYLQGKWVNYDSALGYKKCPADRITFSVSSLAGEDLTESMIPVMNLIQNITVSLK